MKPLAFGSTTIASLLLCVATALLWAWSYVRVEGWTWSDGVRVPTAGYQVAWRQAVISETGAMYFIRDRRMGGSAFLRRLDAVGAQYLPRVDASHRVLGIGYQSRSGYPFIASSAFGPPVVLTRVWTVPHWAIALLTMVLPASWIVRKRRRRAMSLANHCLACGYDLRATPERCPECGASAGELRPAAAPSP